jgi:hypothetical protein
MCITCFGRYRVLCRSEDAVDGVVWYAPSVKVVERLGAYEGMKYYDPYVDVESKDGEKILTRAFLWEEDEYGEELADAPLSGRYLGRYYKELIEVINPEKSRSARNLS